VTLVLKYGAMEETTGMATEELEENGLLFLRQVLR
jgi:hypothetical protein